MRLTFVCVVCDIHRIVETEQAVGQFVAGKPIEPPEPWKTMTYWQQDAETGKVNMFMVPSCSDQCYQKIQALMPLPNSIQWMQKGANA